MRRSSLFWGLVIIFAGIVLLLNSLGILQVNFWQLIWPFMLILAGVYFLLGPVLFKSDLKEETISIPTESISQAEIEFNHGAGRLEIGSMDTPGLLVAGSCIGGVNKNVSRIGFDAKVKLSSPAEIFMGFPMRANPEGLRWRLNLARGITLKLDFQTGASESNLDLSDLKVVDLKISTGASATTVKLPSNAGYTKMKVESGLASLKIYVPEGVSGRISSDSGLSSVTVDSSRFPSSGKGYETPGYDTAQNKVEINIQSGVGSVEIL
jgi:hypothetical protein